MKVVLLISIFVVSGCLKSTEDLRREKLVDSLDTQMKQSQKLVADLTIKLKDYEQRMAAVNGQIETIEHTQSTSVEERQKELSQTIENQQQKILELEKKIEDQNKTISGLNLQVKEQTAYSKKITKSLSSILGKKTSYKSTLSTALNYVNKKNYKKAKPMLEELLAEKLSAADRNKVFHGLGLISYHDKKFDDALVYFSKIYQKWPRSSLSPNSLYYIGKSFKAQGKLEEAKAIFEEVGKKYPKSRQAKQAKEEISKL